MYKGKAYALPTQVISQISMQHNRGPYGIAWSHNAIQKGVVIAQGQTLSWIMVNDSTDNAIFRREFPQMKSYIYYHSIYGERWHSTWNDGGEMVIKD